MLRREAADTERRERGERTTVAAWQILLLGALLAGWWGASGRIVDRLFLSDPVSIARAFWRMVVDGSLGFHLQYTLTETLLGYVLGA